MFLASSSQVRFHNREMDIFENLDRLQFDDDCVFNKQVKPMRANDDIIIFYRNLNLVFNS